MTETSNLMVRLAEPCERAALEALQWRASLANDGDRDALLANPDAIELPMAQIEAGQVFVGERAGTVVGFAAVLPRPDGAVELDGLFVEPALFRGGVGRALVERCVEDARARGASRLHVVGNFHAEGFYAACGFTMLGEAATRFGPALSMERLVG